MNDKPRVITVTETSIYKWEIPAGEPLPFETDETGQPKDTPPDAEQVNTAAEWFVKLHNPFAEATWAWVEDRQIEVE